MITINPVQSPQDKWQDTKRLHMVRLLVFSGSYTQGGDTLNLAADFGYKSATTPLWGSIDGQQGAYSYLFIRGTSPSTCLVKIYVNSTGLELAAGTYPLAIQNDIVELYVIALTMQ